MTRLYEPPFGLTWLPDLAAGHLVPVAQPTVRSVPSGPRPLSAACHTEPSQVVRNRFLTSWVGWHAFSLLQSGAPLEPAFPHLQAQLSPSKQVTLVAVTVAGPDHKGVRHLAFWLTVDACLRLHRQAGVALAGGEGGLPLYRLLGSTMGLWAARSRSPP